MATADDLYRGREVTVTGEGDGTIIQAEGDWARVEFENRHSKGVKISQVTIKN